MKFASLARKMDFYLTTTASTFGKCEENSISRWVGLIVASSTLPTIDPFFQAAKEHKVSCAFDWQRIRDHVLFNLYSNDQLPRRNYHWWKLLVAEILKCSAV